MKNPFRFLSRSTPLEPVQLHRRRPRRGGSTSITPRRRTHTAARPRQVQRSVQSGMASNLTSDWSTSVLATDTLLRQYLRPMKARSRERVINDDTARRFVNLCKTNMVGERGIVAQCQAVGPDGKPWDAARQAIEAGWKKWGKKGSCDVTGKLSWIRAQSLFVETVATDGESLARVIKTQEFNPFGLSLQFYDSERLPVHQFEEMREDKSVKLGVEFNKWKRPTAYYIQAEDGSYFFQGASLARVPAEEMIHSFIIERVDQVRGIPWMATAMWRMRMLGGYQDASVVNARASAAKGGFFTSPTGEGYKGDEVAADGSLIMDLSPGQARQLADGVTFIPYDPTFPQQQFGDFVKSMLRSAASGLNVSYHSLSNDLEGVNFSSIRQGVLDDRAAWMLLQSWMIEEFCDPVYQRWLESALVTGQIEVEGKTLGITDYTLLSPVLWQPRRWPWVDPLKDVNAATKTVEGGFGTEAEVIRAKGRDPEEVWRERAWELKRKKEIMEAEGVSEPEKEEPIGGKSALLTMTRDKRLNQRALAYAKARIELGYYDLEDPWLFTVDDAEALSAAPGRYYLSEDPELDGAIRWTWPTGKKVDGEFTVSLAALAAIRDGAAHHNDIYAAAGELMGLMESGEDVSTAADDDDTDGGDGAPGEDDGDKPPNGTDPVIPGGS